MVLKIIVILISVVVLAMASYVAFIIGRDYYREAMDWKAKGDKFKAQYNAAWQGILNVVLCLEIAYLWLIVTTINLVRTLH